MRVQANLLFLGVECIPSKKVEGKVYNQINFLDGNRTCNIITENASLFQKVSSYKQLSPCVVDLDLRLGRYTNCKVVQCELVK